MTLENEDLYSYFQNLFFIFMQSALCLRNRSRDIQHEKSNAQCRDKLLATNIHGY